MTDPLKQTIIDFGLVPLDSAEFIITDSECIPSSKIIAAIASVDTDDNDADEMEMSQVVCWAGKTSIGSFRLLVTALSGPVTGKFAVNYKIG